MVFKYGFQVWFSRGFLKAMFNGEPTVMITVDRVGDEDTINSSTAVKNYVRRLQPTLPQGLNLTVWIDECFTLGARIDALTKMLEPGSTWQ
jgi:multidrug efflux pump subunit AcrB